MRAMIASKLYNLMAADKRLVLLLGGVGAYQVSKIRADFSERVYDLGLTEQAIIGMAAGLAHEGMIPVVYGISPFFVERAYEQLKLDVGYNHNKIVLIGLGAPYDYSHEGPTHHCPGDMALLFNIPDFDLLAPGTATEAATLLEQAIKGDNPAYLRISSRVNWHSYSTFMGRACAVRNASTDAAVIAVGPILQNVLDGLGKLPATILYYSTLAPFDDAPLRISRYRYILAVEYGYPVLPNIIAPLGLPAKVRYMSIPRKFMETYGTVEDLDKEAGLDPDSIREAFRELYNG